MRCSQFRAAVGRYDFGDPFALIERLLLSTALLDLVGFDMIHAIPLATETQVLR